MLITKKLLAAALKGKAQRYLALNSDMQNFEGNLAQ